MPWIQDPPPFFLREKTLLRGQLRGFGESVCIQCWATHFFLTSLSPWTPRIIILESWSSHASSHCSKDQVSVRLSRFFVTYSQLPSWALSPVPTSYTLILPTALATICFPFFKCDDGICCRVKVCAVPPTRTAFTSPLFKTCPNTTSSYRIGLSTLLWSLAPWWVF